VNRQRRIYSETHGITYYGKAKWKYRRTTKTNNMRKQEACVLNYGMQGMKTDEKGDGRIGTSSITYQFGPGSATGSLLIAKQTEGYSPAKSYDTLQLEITVSVIALDHVGDTFAALHPGLDQLGKHLEDTLAGACALLLENGWGDAAELESKVGLFPVPPPLLKIHGLYLWGERLGFDGPVFRVVWEAGGG
jgi:hypothetical protein